MRTSRFGTTLLLLTTTIIGVAGCTHGRRPIDAPAIRHRSGVYSSRYIIAAPEIGRAHMLTAYDLLARLRPEFLKSAANRNADGSVSPPVVYINGVMAGEVAVLRDISTDMIVEIRFVPSRDATTYHGQAHRGGEIMVYTYRARGVQPPF
jgi:hypothetical protein